MRKGCLTGAHSLELVLELSTSVGLECNDVGGVELHMIKRKECTKKKEKKRQDEN
jgi:hypothetical protein